ncbi:lysozyme [Candidatus Liberibacter brunswickensis]|uniref:lysozyme n=1 Tax=Candidatus Liberibacter brunswickensis TaxID=1968796 RepID=UPI002FDF55C5
MNDDVDDGNNAVPIPDILIDMIKKYEGCILTAYKDSSGFLTIGYGHTGLENGIKVTENMTITQEEAEEILKDDLRYHFDLILEASPNLATVGNNRLTAVADFVFNLGIDNYKKSTFKKRIDAEDWEQASIECMG